MSRPHGKMPDGSNRRAFVLSMPLDRAEHALGLVYLLNKPVRPSNISNLVMSNLKLHGEPGDAEILQLDIAWLHDVIERDATGFGRRVHEPRKTDQGKIRPQMFQNQTYTSIRYNSNAKVFTLASRLTVPTFKSLRFYRVINSIPVSLFVRVSASCVHASPPPLVSVTFPCIGANTRLPPLLPCSSAHPPHRGPRRRPGRAPRTCSVFPHPATIRRAAR